LPRNGQQVLVRGRVSLYEPRGDFQIIVEYVEEAGPGRCAGYDALRLNWNGRIVRAGTQQPCPLSTADRVITSASGAAIRDVLITCAAAVPACPS